MTTREWSAKDWPIWKADCLKWHGRILIGKDAHYCYDWDGLPIDETCEEFRCCTDLEPEVVDI